MPSHTHVPLLILALLAPMSSIEAQNANAPIYEQGGRAIKESHQKIIQQALRVRDEVPTIFKAEIDAQLLNPVPEPIQLPAPRTDVMLTENIANCARETNLRVGYCYKCMKCDDWHIKLAGGYAIAPDVIATCDHVLATQTQMRDGFLIAVDHEGNVACGVAILARSAAMDAAIVKVAGAGFAPVPLNADVAQGSSAHCFSYPLRQQGYFSTGIVNRFFWNDQYSGEDPETIDALFHLRVNFSTDWAPGSSGAPVFDSAGNVIGHVSTIASLGSGKNKPALLTLRTGIPALAVQQLARTLQHPDEIQRIAKIGAKESGSPAADQTPPEK